MYVLEQEINNYQIIVIVRGLALCTDEHTEASGTIKEIASIYLHQFHHSAGIYIVTTA